MDHGVVVLSFPDPGGSAKQKKQQFDELIERTKEALAITFAAVPEMTVYSAVDEPAAAIISFLNDEASKPDKPEKEESNLVRHARRELELLGQTESDPEFAESIIAAVRGFSKYGHSGGSAGAGISILHALLEFKNLSPLTDNPDEWNHVAYPGSMGKDDGDVWQNNRNPEAFSTDGGKTHYFVSNEEREIHQSAKR